MTELREEPTVEHRPERLVGRRVAPAAASSAIWIADREPPLPPGFEERPLPGAATAA
jgi:hypothetical protein